LENYVPEIGHSTSDYHHVKPLAQAKKLSTRQFSQPGQKGHGRAISRFTVVSNISRCRHSSNNSGYADTEAAETVQSYDPFRASRPQNLAGTVETAQTNVVVHRGRPVVQEVKATSRSSRKSSSTSRVSRGRQQHLAPPRGFASRSSLASSTRSRGSTHGPRVAVLHKRGISFSHVRKLSGVSQKKGAARELQPGSGNFDRSIKTPDVIDDRFNFDSANVSPAASARFIRSQKTTVSSPQPLLSLPKHDRVSRLWNEDVRQLSSSLAKTCDEAFNRTSVVSTVHTKMSSLEDSQNAACDSPISSFDQGEIRQECLAVAPLQVQKPAACPRGDRSYLNSRPLPPPPTRSDSVNIELAEARKKFQLRKLSGTDSPGYIDRMVSHIDQLMQPSPLPQKSDRRALSAPINFRGHETGRPLPSINESNREGTYSDRSSDYENFMLLERVKVAESGRHVSAPESRIAKRSPHHDLDDRTSRRNERSRQGIREVQPYSPSPAKPPAPLNIRKKASQGPSLVSGVNGGIGSKERPPKFDLRQQYSGSSTTPPPQLSSLGENKPPYDPFADESSSGTVRKKSNWFKRSSKSGEDNNMWSITSKVDGRMAQATSGAGRHYFREDLDVSTKKKSFGFGRIFNRHSLKKESRMSIAGKYPLRCISRGARI
jgi:serine/threonine-protein kinase HSL1, negative regulator of Swe1 kinase